MKKLLFSTLFLFLLCSFARAQFGISASAICLNVNGATDFYNTQNSSGTGAIGKLAFAGNLGVFGNNSGNLKIIGAALNSFKSNGGNVCNSLLYYTVYQQNNRPIAPTFSSVNLALYSSVSNSVQKWQGLSNAIDLTTFTVGNYTLEIYYAVAGGAGTCAQQQLDNAGGGNYTANFTIAAPLALNFSSLFGIVNDDYIQIKWATQNDVNINNYEIQKSDNGLNFTTIGSINSKHSNTGGYYYFNDAAPWIGTNYYRIKCNNDNSSINLSGVVRLYFGTVGNTVLIYPNPSGNVLIARLAGINKGSYQLSILTSTCQQILTMPLQHDGVDKTLHINLPVTLSKGVYRLFLIDEKRFYKQAFLVK